MAVYIVTGKLGTGKGKYAIGKIKEAVREGRRVATNCDLVMEHLAGAQSRVTAMRIPDRPLAQDLRDIGHGNPDDPYNEERAGVLVLDELGSWLNSRTFASSERLALLDWLIHARKHGWECYLLVQHLDMIDKQVRLGLAEYIVECMRLDKVKLPIVGDFLGKRGKLPRIHVARTVMQAMPSVVIDREFYRGTDLHDAYDTLQEFREWHRDPTSPRFADEQYMGVYSYLSGWHVAGRNQPAAAPKPGRLHRLFGVRPLVRPPLRPKLPAVHLAAKLPRDEAWALARRYVRAAP